MTIKPTLRELKELEKKYARAMIAYGPNNLDTIRKEIAYRDAKEQRESSRRAILHQLEGWLILVVAVDCAGV